MRKILFCFVVFVVIPCMLDCGPRVMVPPRIDLKQYEVIGIIDFSFSSKGKLAIFTTKRFMEEMRRDQGMVRIVELGSMAEVLESVGHDRFSPTAFKDIGTEYEINTIITGELNVSNIKPNVAITPGLGFISFSALVDATLSVQMVETLTGASIWSSSAEATKEVGHISIFGGKDFAFNADDPEEAYGKLVNALVYEVTRDFKVTWVRK